MALNFDEKVLGDRFNRYRFDKDVFVRIVLTVGANAGDIVQNIKTVKELAENGVAFCRVNDEELASDGMRHHGLCPAESTAQVGEAFVVLVADGRIWTLCCMATRAVPAGKVTALNHETLDDAVERSAVVFALLGKFDEIRSAFANDFREEACAHFTVIRLDDGDRFSAFWEVKLIEHKWNLQVGYVLT